MTQRPSAEARFKTMLIVIVVAGLVMGAGAIVYLSATGDLSFHLVTASLAGVFFSVLLGCGLFALAFFSERSGHDQMASDAIKPEPGNGAPAPWPERAEPGTLTSAPDERGP
jgi:hypothetical protein